jgi:RHS repeat-associated protein
VQNVVVRGAKLFELSNHLGNVLVTISDKRLQQTTDSSTVAYYKPDVINANDYYSFGMLMPGRSYTVGTAAQYRYGFNGKEDDNEVKGTGDQIDYGMRIYDPRVGRFMSIDPVAKQYPELTPYQFASNRPIDGADLDGKEWELRTTNDNLRRIPQIRNDEFVRSQGSIKTWDGQPNFWGKAKQFIGAMRNVNAETSAGLSIVYGIIDDAHVTYTGWKNGRGYATHLDNSSVGSYDERITAGVNTFTSLMGGIEGAGETAVLGRLSIGMQGELGEELFGGNLNFFSKNFKTFDNFEDGVATSVKTLDLGAPTYLDRPSAITSKLNGYTNKIAGFTEASGGDFTLRASMIDTKELGVLTIGTPNAAQSSALRLAQQYAESNGVKFTLKSAPLSDPLTKGLLASPKTSTTQLQSQQP